MSRRTRPAEERLRRLLVMLPWLMERGEVPLAEVAERFDLGEDEVAKDLELVAMCGLPPFVDELIDVFIDEGHVFVGVPRLFTRPLRLVSPEAFELLAAGRAAMELPGADPDGPLGRGLAKLAAALGDVAGPDDVVEVDLERPPIVDELVAIADDHEAARIEYWSASSDKVTDRRISPVRVFADRGHWYVTAADDRSGEVRSFRVDRIATLARTGEPGAEVPDPLPEPGEWFADGSLPRVTLRLDPSARWVAERYPVDEVTVDDDGSTIVRLAVSSDRWMERLSVRLGPAVEVVEPERYAELGRDAAGRILARYDTVG